MAGTLFHLRSSLKVKSCICQLPRNTVICNKIYFADDSSKKNDLYDTLGVASNATHGEIKKAYYDLTFKYHPDRNESCNISSTKFREVTEAYEVLGNFGLRKKYDKGMPVSLMKKTAPAPVNHTAKYQEFFDSRITQQDFNDRSTDFEGLGISKKKVEEELESAKQEEEALKAPFGLQFLVALFICILMYITKR